MFTLRSVRQRLDFAKSNLYTRVKKITPALWREQLPSLLAHFRRQHISY